MTITGLGIDIVEIKRFKNFKRKDAAFLKKVFSDKELDYCFSFAEPAPRLAGIFAAKEAVVKASSGKVSILGVEIRHRKNGQPEVLVMNKLQKSLMVSISHTDKLACTIALRR